MGCQVGAAVVGTKRAGCGNGDVYAAGIAGIEQDGVQAHTAGSRLPVWSGTVFAQAGKLLPRLAAIGGTK